MHRWIARSVTFVLAATLFVSLAGVDARMLRFPDVSETQLTFVYAGDIWVAPKDGGQAYRLSTPSGEERFPRFSPNGEQIAFSGNYDGNEDIYVVPTAGGISKRLTHHPMGDRLTDWYPDGKSVLFSSSRESGKQRFNQLYKLSKEGGLPTKLPIPYGEFGSLSDDGEWLAYMPVTRDFRTWKRYRGGSTTDIWLFNLKTNKAKNITTTNSNDGQPMWHGSKVYFQSDRDANKRSNLWVYDTKDESVRQLTKFTDYDIRFPAIGPSDIVFENGGRLYLMDLATEKTREVEIEVATDRATLKPRMVNAASNIQWGDISPTGKRVVMQARGELFSLPAEHGPVRNLSQSSGTFERTPAWSPDGKWLAYFSDKTGEYELTIRSADGKGEEQTLTKLGPGFRYNPQWSPDGKKISWVNQAMEIKIFNRDTKKVTDVDQALLWMHGPLSGFQGSWSSDSRWFAYARDLENDNHAIMIFDTDENKRHQVTSGFYDDNNPSFDPEGNHLFFTSNRNFSPTYGDFGNHWSYPNSTHLVAVPLRKDVDSPLHARNDEEEVKEDEKDDGDKKEDADEKKGKKKKGDDDAKKDEEKKDEDGDKPEPVKIDFDDFERRLIELPIPPGNIGSVAAVSGKVIYWRFPNTGANGGPSSLMFFDLKEREDKKIMDNVNGYTVSHDGNKILVFTQSGMGIVSVAPGQKVEKPLRIEEMKMELDPKAEWKQIFNDVWRLERDYFYDPGMHGVDWKKMRERYGKLIDDAVTRWDVNFVIGELIAELSASHAYRGGGDTENGPRQRTGMLGANFALENGAYKIAKIIDGAVWDNEVRSPLNEPGLDINEGDYLLAVNGVPVDTSKDPWAAFQGLANQAVQLTVNDKPSMEDAREVFVTTLADETRLRNLNWIEGNRKKVEEATDGRVAYIYVPSTGVDGQTELLRMFQGQYHMPGMIIDERFNNGGQIPDRFVELLNRPLYNYWGVRDGRDWQWPPFSHTGPKVMLMNEWSGSGGDCFPFYFKQAGLGPLIGTRTWGGLIGISGSPGLIDGGVATVPTFGIYSTEGEWIIENYGVDPDIEVDDDPSLMLNGGDPQLDRAIEEALKLLEQNPPRRPRKPRYPDRS